MNYHEVQRAVNPLMETAGNRRKKSLLLTLFLLYNRLSFIVHRYRAGRLFFIFFIYILPSLLISCHSDIC